MAKQTSPKLAVGRIVLYVLNESEELRGEIRPAIVTRVNNATSAQLTVFPDGANDFPLPRKVQPLLPDGTVVFDNPFVTGKVGVRPPGHNLSFAVSSAALDQDDKKPGTFHFPEID